MEKTIFDVNPPEKEEKYQPDRVFPAAKIQKPRSKRFPKILVLLFLSCGAAFFLIRPEAEVKVWPYLQTRDFSIQARVDESVENIDLEENIIPGRALEAEKLVSENFKTTGLEQRKAEGTIVLYNKYTTGEENWREGTRFISSEGKLFYSKSAITVPGAKYVGGDLVPGSVEVQVVAAEPGEDYNIDPTKFSVYVYRGTAKYPYYWAESSLKMQGGGSVSVVTSQDLESAEEALSEKAKSQSKETLKAGIPEGWILAESLVESEIIEVIPLSQEGQVQESFTFQVSAKSRGIAFKKDDIKSLVEKRISENIDLSQEISPFNMDIEYDMTEDLALTISVSAEIYQGMDESLLKKSCFGKTPFEAEQSVLSGFSGVEKIEIDLKPFWARRVPEDVNKVAVEFVLE